MRRLMTLSAIALVLAAAFLTGSGGAGLGSSAAAPVRAGERAIPAGLTDAIQARFGARRIAAQAKWPGHPNFGLEVALSADGTTALVAAPGDALKSEVYVYHAASAGAWASSSTPTATLSSPSLGGFGSAVALSADGTTAFVGDPWRNKQQGAVDVFHVSDEASWVSTSTPTATLKASNSRFLGAALAVSSDGTTLVVGAGLGTADIFHASAEAAWVSTSTPTAALSKKNEPCCGINVLIAMSGDGTTVLLSDLASSSAGEVYLFHAASEAGWVTSTSPTAILSDASGEAVNGLGWSLALSGDGTTAFVGALGVNAYAIDVFHVAAANSWATSATPTAILSDAASNLGGAPLNLTKVSADGSTVVLPAAAKPAGALDVFHVSDEAAWTTTSTPAARLTEPAADPHDAFGEGQAISADGATVLAGAPGFFWGTGEVHVFHVADASSWITTSTPAATLTNSALPKPFCLVPRLKGSHVSSARSFLAYDDCRLGTVLKVHVKDKELRRLIVSQRPRPLRHRPAGWKVNVWVGK
jgi:hypothetical protein